MIGLYTPDTVRVHKGDGTYTIVKCHIYPLKAEEAFYDTQQTVQNPNELLAEPQYRNLFKISTAVEHIESEFMGVMDPPVWYHVAAVPRGWISGGPVLGTETVQVLLSENREVTNG